MRIVFFVLGALILGVSGMVSAAEEPASNEAKKIRVGVYDSRAVAIAYTHSKSGQQHLGQQIDKLKKELAVAEAAGDKAKVEQIKAEGQAGQERLHQQGFGTASVKKYLELVKDKLPGVAKKAQVDFVVSKWDVTYQSPGAEVVDITDEIVQVFEPNDRVLKIVEELKKHQPMDEEEIRNTKGL
jgi:hypothetical protein